MQTRLDIFKEITLLFTLSDYKSMQNVVLKYFTIADSFGAHESNDIKKFLYLVYLLTLLKLNEKSEAISSMLFCLKANQGYLDDLDLKNPIYFILNSMTEEIGIDIYSVAQESHSIHPACRAFFGFLNRLPTDVLIETCIARASLDKDLAKNYDEEFISLFNTWLKRGLEQNDTVSHIFHPLKLFQATVIKNTDIDINQFLQQNYYPALESLAFLIISHRIPTIDCREHFLVAERDHPLDYFSNHFNKDF